jgi:tRNA(Arg) A34 adenosine deaminase TadA
MTYANIPLRNPYNLYDYYSEPVSNTDTSFLSAACKIAQTSDYRFRMAALLVKSGRVLGGDVNVPRITPDTPPQRCSTHAEVRVLKSTKNTQGSTLYVARLLLNGEVAMAKPCVWCLETIISSGVSKVVFTIDDYRADSFYTNIIEWK